MSNVPLGLAGGLVLSLLLSGCTLAGLAGGGIYAGTKNGDVRVQMGERPRTSVGASMAVGGGIGLALDIAIFALAVAASGGVVRQ